MIALRLALSHAAIATAVLTKLLLYPEVSWWWAVGAAAVLITTIQLAGYDSTRSIQ